MKRAFVALTVVMLFILTAVPAMAIPITFNFYGEIAGNFDDAVGFDGTYAITAFADTSNLASGNLIDGTPVLYYADPFIFGNLTLTGSTYDLADNADLGTINTTYGIASPLYLALDQIGGALGFGVWDAAMINDPLDSPFTGDVVTAWGLLPTYDMASGFWASTFDFMNGGGLLLASGETFNFELVPEGSSLTYSASVPEPSMLLLFGTGLAGLGLLRRKI